MIDTSLREEALQQANSEEGMEQLIHALLHFRIQDPLIEQLLIELNSKIRSYVLLKRIRRIHQSGRIRRVPFKEPWVSEDQIYTARAAYKVIEQELINRVKFDWRKLQSMKKLWGSMFKYSNIKLEDKNTHASRSIALPMNHSANFHVPF